MGVSTAVFERRRGDTFSDQVTVVDAAGAAVNVTGYTFKLTLTTIPRPSDALTKLLDIDGTITDAAGGVVEFPWSAADADQTPGKYWFDVEQTDDGAPGLVTTILEGSYNFVQDRTK